MIDIFLNNIGLLVVLIIPLVIMGQLLFDVYWGGKCYEWPSTKGRIIESFVSRGRRGSYHANVRYSYEVNGKEYVGKRISFGEKWPSKHKAYGDKKSYHIDRKVTVYYHPRISRIATLETELPFVTYFYLLIMSLITFFIVVVVIPGLIVI